MKMRITILLIVFIPIFSIAQDEFNPKRLLSGSFSFFGQGSGTKGLDGTDLGTTPLSESSSFSLGTSARILKQRSKKWAMGPGISYSFGKNIYERNQSSNFITNSMSNIFTCFYQFRYTLFTKGQLSLYLAPEPFYGIRFYKQEYSIQDVRKTYEHRFGVNLVGGITYLLDEKFQLNLQYNFFSFSKGISVDKTNELITNSTSIRTLLAISTFSIGGELLF